jgi:hypothetical protein
VPFAPKDFTFCAKGFAAETAEATREAYHQAFVLSKLFDYVPDVSNEFVTDEMQQTPLSVEVPDVVDDTRMTVKPGKLTLPYSAMMNEYLKAVKLPRSADSSHAGGPTA